MSALSELKPMAKRPGRPRKSERKDTAVKVDSGVISMARYVADRRGITLAEYLSELLAVPVKRDFTREAKAAEGANE